MSMVLVTGAGGFVGKAAVRALAAAGHEVRAALRRRGTAVPVDVEPVVADVLDPASLARAMQSVAAVVHCAVGGGRDTAVIVEGTRNVLAAAASAGVSRFIHLSSVAVYGDAAGRIDEDAPTDRPHGAYGAAKVAAEAACADQADRMAIAILRPSLIYGPGGTQWTTLYLDRLKTGRWPDLGMAGEGDANLIHVEDLAAFITFLVAAPRAIGGTFNVNGPEVPSWNDYLRRLGAAAGHPPAGTKALPGRGALLARKAGKALAAALAKAHVPHGGLDRRLLMIPSADEVARFRTTVHYATGRMQAAGFTPAIGLDRALVGIAAWDRAGRPPI